MSSVVLCDQQWWLLNILFIIMLLVHMYDSMQQAIIVELVHGVLLFTFDGGFVTFWCEAKRVVIIFHARSSTHYHELMISLVTHRIVPATSVSPRIPPAPLILMVIFNPWDPLERLESSIPWNFWETSPFWGELWDSPPIYETEPQPVLDWTIVPFSIPWHIFCPICQDNIEQGEVYQHDERDVIRQIDIDLMTHQLQPFIITRAIQYWHTVNKMCPDLPTSISHRDNPCTPHTYPSSCVSSFHNECIPILVTPHLTEQLNQGESNTQAPVSALTDTIYSLPWTVASNSIRFIFD